MSLEKAFEKIKPHAKKGSRIQVVIAVGKEMVEVEGEAKKVKPVASSDHPPCQDCGNTDFVRTGTCFACVTCGASQGCS